MPQNQPKKSNPSLWIVLTLVALIAAAAILYFGDFFNTNTNSNANQTDNENTNVSANVNAAGNQNTNTSTNTNAGVDTSGWKTYQNTQYGFIFKYPQEWIVKNDEVSGGSFQVDGLLDQIVINPKNSSLDFQAASECSIGVFSNSENRQIETWLEGSGLYAESEGLSIQSQENKKIGNIDGIQIYEGGPNYTNTVSYFFTINERVFRFGFYKGVDVTPQDEFQADSAICNTILTTLSK